MIRVFLVMVDVQHNCRLVRDMSVRRTCQVDKDGILKWTRKDSVSMICPATSHQVKRHSDEVTTMPYNTKLGATNKRTRISTHGEMNQSEVQNPVMSVKNDEPSIARLV